MNIVQQNVYTNSSATQTYTLSAVPTVGNNLIARILLVGYGGFQVNSITGGGVSWIKILREPETNTANVAEMWYGENCTGAGGTDAITVTISGGTGHEVALDEWSGLASSSSLLLSAGDHQIFTSISVGPLTPTAGVSCLLIGIAGSNNTPTTLASGWTPMTHSSSGVAGAYQLVSNASGGYTYSYASNGSGWAAVFAVFAAASGGGGGSGPIMPSTGQLYPLPFNVAQQFAATNRSTGQLFPL